MKGNVYMKRTKEKIQYIKLSKKWYETYKNENYPEILGKSNRPYLYKIISYNDYNVIIPLRSNINHKYGFKLNKNGGLDYSKSLFISKEELLKVKKCTIEAEDHKIIKQEIITIEKQYKKYIKEYKKAYNSKAKRSKELLKNSTLQYFHKEMGIK